MSNVQGEMRQFEFGLEPIIECVPGLLAALEIEFKSAGAYLILRRIIDHHESPLATNEITIAHLMENANWGKQIMRTRSRRGW